MEAVLGLIVMLLGLSHGVETYCDGRPDGAQCYGALGGTVDIQLMNSTSKIPRYQLLKNSLKILDVRKKKILSNIIQNRSLFFPSNGTFRLNYLSRNDSGNYSLITFNSDGKASDEQTLHLFVQAPVSSVLLVSECLSQGERRVSCSSEGGDSPQHSWTLDGRTLTDAELLSGNNETNIITLKQHVSGYLACSVSNNISNVFNKERISTCGFIFINCTSVSGTQISESVHKTNNTVCTEPAQSSVGNLSLIGGGLSALVIFIAVSAAIICSEKKQNDKRLKQNENGDGQEVYADVGVVAGEAKGENSRAGVNQVFKMNLPD